MKNKSITEVKKLRHEAKLRRELKLKLAKLTPEARLRREAKLRGMTVATYKYFIAWMKRTSRYHRQLLKDLQTWDGRGKVPATIQTMRWLRRNTREMINYFDAKEAKAKRRGTRR